MTEDQQTPNGPESPAARAARRARRIGGRSQVAPPTAPAPAAPTPAEASPADTVPRETLEHAAPAAPEAPVAEAAPRPRSGLLSWLPAAILAAACVFFLVWGVVASRGVWWDKGSSAVRDDRGAVLAAAKSCMATMNTYDYRKLDANEAAGSACTTGTFTSQYRQAFEKLIKPQAAKVKFTQTAQINNAGIESVSGNGRQWVVLVFGQLSTTNSQTGTSTPTLTPFSARVTMQQAAGKWLVANYQYAPSS